MFFLNKIKELIKDKKYIMYVDMDGVISAYDFGNPSDFKNKRPLMHNIKLLEQISKMDNIELRILSVCRFDYQIIEKEEWLDMYAPFFDKSNRVIISKETFPGLTSSMLKANYLKGVDYENIILVDDDNLVLKTVNSLTSNVICIQDSELID